MTLPTGRVSTPRLAIASHTRMPARSRKANGSRVRQSLTNSMPAIKPTCRMSPTCGSDQSVCNSSRRSVSRFCARANGCCALQNFQARQRRRRAELIARVTVAVEKGFELLVFAQKRVKNFLRRQRRRHRQIAAGQAFGQAQKIRLHAFVLAGKQAVRTFRALPTFEVSCTILSCQIPSSLHLRSAARRGCGRFRWRACSQPAGCGIMPAAPCINGSKTNAA